MRKVVKVERKGLLTALALAAVMVVSGYGGCCGSDQDKMEGCETGICPMEKPADVKATATSAVVAKEAVINTEGLATLIRSKVPVKVLDARSGKYDDGRRVPGAQQLSPTAEADVVSKVLPDKNALVVTYCAGLTCPASKMLAEHLKKLGYTNVIEYPQGIAGWAEAGNTVEQKKGE